MKDVTVGCYSQIGEGVKCGEQVHIGRNCIIYGPTEIDDGTTIKDGVIIGHNTLIGKECLISPGVIIGEKGYTVYEGEKPVMTVLEDSVIVGPGAIILPGVQICRGAIIFAGKVVVNDIIDELSGTIGPTGPRNRHQIREW